MWTANTQDTESVGRETVDGKNKGTENEFLICQKTISQYFCFYFYNYFFLLSFVACFDLKFIF